jgi:hypothetical protein
MNRFAEIAERIAARPLDSKGQPIRPIGEYTLREKGIGKKWYGGGSLVANSILVNENDAAWVSGGMLLGVMAVYPEIVTRWEIIREDE